jgi:CheY-like chemotaxis protein
MGSWSYGSFLMRAASQKEDGELRILLVEDNPFDYELIEATLQMNLDCQVTTVSSKQAFEAVLAQEPPDFIISDSNLPSFDGLAALALAAQLCPAIPYIFCSGNKSAEARTEALEHGAKAYVFKDNLESLVATIKRLSKPKSDGKNSAVQT